MLTDHPAQPRHPAAPAVVEPYPVGFSTRIPHDLLERLRRAAPQLRMHQAEITTAALHDYLTRHGH